MNNALEMDRENSKFFYFYAAYTQFHSLAILLGELIDNPRCSSSKRIWACVDRLFELAKRPDVQWARRTDTPDWEAVRTLYANACKLRVDEPRGASRMPFNGGDTGTVAGSINRNGNSAADRLQDNARMERSPMDEERQRQQKQQQQQQQKERAHEARMYDAEMRRQNSEDHERKVMQQTDFANEVPIDIDWSSWDRMMVEGIFNDFLLPGENMAMI